MYHVNDLVYQFHMDEILFNTLFSHLKKKIKVSWSGYVIIKQISEKEILSEIILDKEGHLIMIKRSIYHGDIINLNMNVPNSRASKYRKQKLVEVRGNVDKYTIIVGDFNTPFSVLLEQTENQ